MLKVIELFAGIGAQREALKRADIEHEVVAISEIDKYALKVYEKLHGVTNNLGDIKTIDKLPKSDLWTYSFPCTDISLAGRRKGMEKGSNTGSSLLWEVERLLEESSRADELPKYLLLENVKALVSKKFMPHFQEWCSILETHGYKNFWQVMNAKDYGVPQNRERVFLISIRDENATYEFPKKQELKVRLFDLLERDVDEKYFLSQKLITCFSDLSDRNGFIRGLRFRPHTDLSNHAWTISTCPGSRATDNFIVVPATMRGRINEDGKYEQRLECKDDATMNALTTVHKDNLIVLLPENTKKGYTVANSGDGVYTNRCHQKRGVVQKSAVPTIKCSVNDIGVVVDRDEMVSIRRLTPRECWRLMGWNDGRIDEAFNCGVSETQLYKMAGNSIVVNVIDSILVQKSV